jgi:YVTN family beta-propeller protein
VGFTSVWVANTAGDTLTRIDERTNDVLTRITVGDAPVDVVVGGESIWATNTRKEPSVMRVDPGSDAVTKTFPGRTLAAEDRRVAWMEGDGRGRRSVPHR